MSVSVVIPAFRAASTIAATVRAAAAIPAVSETIVVDDGSDDETAHVARASGADQVLVLPRNRGKGTALAAGARAAHNSRLLFLDADLGGSAVHAGRLLAAAADEGAMAVAVFPARRAAAGFGLARGLARAAIRLLTGLRVAAPLSGQRALPSRLVNHVGLASRFGVEVGLTVEAAHLGVPVLEVCVPFEHRHTARTAPGFLHRARQFGDVLRVLLLIGYGLGWPALSRRRVAARLLLWLAALGALIGLGRLVSGSLSHTIMLAFVCAACAWLPSLWITAVWMSLRKPNFLARSLPAAAGLLVLLVGLPFLWFSHLPTRVRVASSIVIIAFGALGLLDDLFGARARARGVAGHLRSLLRGRVTTGSLKAVGGLAAGVAAGLLLRRGDLALAALDALLIALSANFVNLLDLRPARALKGFTLLCLLSVAASPDSLHLLAPIAVAALVLAPADLAGRVMQGDVGANVLGAAAGLSLTLSLAAGPRLVVVISLLAIHLLCERLSLSDIISRNRLLRWLDRVGTTHLAPLPTPEAASK